MIKPTNGRIVWYTPSQRDAELGLIQHDKAKPLAAIVAHVWSDRMVNLTVFDSNGISHPRASVQLIQEGDGTGCDNSYCEWMPFQKGQAARHEQLEKSLNPAGC